jgi:ferredoxin
MARNLILYFSGTGNSLATTKRIAAKLGDTDIRAMATYPNPEGEYERIGFVFPCYASGLPRFVKNYIEKLDTDKLTSKYYFAVETYGGWPGNSNSQINKILKKKGDRLSFAINIKMFANYIALYSMKGDAEAMAKEADEEISSIAVSIKNKMQSKNISGSFIMGAYYSIALSMLMKKIKDFNVSNDCIGCGKCAKLCPTGNISADTGKPVLSADCEKCMACIQWCPMQAINYKTKTVGKKRYNHPAVKIDEMLLRE